MKEVGVLRNLLLEDRFDTVFECGFTVPVSRVTLENIPTLIKAISIHSTIVPIKAELDQLSEGLKLFRVLDTVRKWPQEMKELFTYNSNTKLTAQDMIRLFDIEFSLTGSSSRQLEEATVIHWNEFLQEVENGLAGMLANYLCSLSVKNYWFFYHELCAPVMICVFFSTVVSAVHSIEGEIEERAITLDILTFATGADRIPPLGFEDILTLKFDSSTRFPLASTCSLSLSLPTRFNDYQDFRKAVIEGVVSGFGFGRC